jgi:hypothetical protein
VLGSEHEDTRKSSQHFEAVRCAILQLAGADLCPTDVFDDQPML